MAAACALAIISGIGFLFGIQKSLRAFLNPLFTGGELPQSKPDGFASSLREGASGETGNFPAMPRALPLGELAR